jgi:hypothetical protein
MTNVLSKVNFVPNILITYTLIGIVAPLTSTLSEPGSSLRSLTLGAKDRAVTIRMRLKNTPPRTRIFITGNVRSLGEWKQPIEMQATEPDGWQVSFATNRAELGVMNSVIFKVLYICLTVWFIQGDINLQNNYQ